MSADRLRRRIRAAGMREGLSAVATAALPAPVDGLASAVSLVLPLSPAVVEGVASGKAPTMSYYHHYRTANALLDRAAFLIAGIISSEGYRALPVPASQTVDRDALAAAFPHKTAAVLAGLGWIGRHALLVTPEHGPWVRLATVLTDMPFPGPPPAVLSRQCGSCRACVEACPAGAVRGGDWAPGTPRGGLVDARACLEYMRGHYMGIGRGSVCGICMAVCGKARLGIIRKADYEE